MVAALGNGSAGSSTAAASRDASNTSLNGSALGKTFLDTLMKAWSPQHGGGLFGKLIVGQSALVDKGSALVDEGAAVMAGLFGQGG